MSFAKCFSLNRLSYFFQFVSRAINQFVVAVSLYKKIFPICFPDIYNNTDISRSLNSYAIIFTNHTCHSLFFLKPVTILGLLSGVSCIHPVKNILFLVMPSSM